MLLERFASSSRGYSGFISRSNRVFVRLWKQTRVTAHFPSRKAEQAFTASSVEAFPKSALIDSNAS